MSIKLANRKAVYKPVESRPREGVDRGEGEGIPRIHRKLWVDIAVPAERPSFLQE